MMSCSDQWSGVTEVVSNLFKEIYMCEHIFNTFRNLVRGVRDLFNWVKGVRHLLNTLNDNYLKVIGITQLMPELKHFEN